MFKRLILETSSAEETVELGQAIGRVLAPSETVLLVGDLGSGKTQLAKGIISAAALVPLDEVVSPTFTLMRRYGGDFAVYHADLYRIEADQVEDIGLDECVELGGALIVEWAEKIHTVGTAVLKVFISHTEYECSRKIVFEWSDEDPWAVKLPEALNACSAVLAKARETSD